MGAQQDNRMGEEKQTTGTIEKQLPGRNYEPGNRSLFQILAEKSPAAAKPVPSDAVVEDKYKEILDNAIPIEHLETIVGKKEEQILSKEHIKEIPQISLKRGETVRHKPSKLNVVILRTEVGVDEKGRILHEVMCRKLRGKKFKVPESSLER
jgi:hypothetical protein